MLESRLLLMLGFALNRYFNGDFSRLILDHFIDEHGFKAMNQEEQLNILKAKAFSEAILKASAEDLGLKTGCFEILISTSGLTANIKVLSQDRLVYCGDIRFDWFSNLSDLKDFLTNNYYHFRQSLVTAFQAA